MRERERERERQRERDRDRERQRQRETETETETETDRQTENNSPGLPAGLLAVDEGEVVDVGGTVCAVTAQLLPDLTRAVVADVIAH